MKRLWMALLFFVGGFTHEVRQPFECQCISVRTRVIPRSDPERCR
jgi:hypothetical protein